MKRRDTIEAETSLFDMLRNLAPKIARAADRCAGQRVPDGFAGAFPNPLDFFYLAAKMAPDAVRRWSRCSSGGRAVD
jgi:hypothetical protein